MKKKILDFLIIIFFIINIFLFIILISLFPYSEVKAEDKIFIRQIISVTDGDTIKIKMDNESDLIKDLGYSVRIYGIDTPEIHSSLKCEKELGLKAKKFLEKIAVKDKQVKIIYITRI